jgi:hypothetical protein
MLYLILTRVIFTVFFPLLLSYKMSRKKIQESNRGYFAITKRLFVNAFSLFFFFFFFNKGMTKIIHLHLLETLGFVSLFILSLQSRTRFTKFATAF